MSPGSASPARGAPRWRWGLLLLLSVAGLVASLAMIGPPSATPFRGGGIVHYPEACEDIEALGLTWYYTWTDDLSCSTEDAAFVPMVWDDWCDDGTDCSQLPRELVARGETTLLGFNEPDWEEQADMTVERALELWAHLDATPLRLGSPAVTTGPRGSAWLEQFMSGARDRGLRVDFLAVHWFGECRSTDDFIEYLRDKRRYGLPIWVTEAACQGESEQVNASFVREAAQRLDEVPELQRIAWFSNRPYPGYEGAALMDVEGRPTSVGDAYLEMPPRRLDRGASRW